jgi:hypothetical protein
VCERGLPCGDGVFGVCVWGEGGGGGVMVLGQMSLAWGSEFPARLYHRSRAWSVFFYPKKESSVPTELTSMYSI